MALELVVVVILFAVLLNISVSVFLASRNDLEMQQKIAQIVIVWLFPFVAALGLWLFNRSHDQAITSDYKKFGGGANDSMDVQFPSEGGD